MAAPHVAGAAALVLQAEPGAAPATVWARLRSASTVGVVAGLAPTTPGLLLLVRYAPVKTRAGVEDLCRRAAAAR